MDFSHLSRRLLLEMTTMTFTYVEPFTEEITAALEIFFFVLHMSDYYTLFYINAVNTSSLAILFPVNCHPSQDRTFGTVNDTKINK